MLIGRLLEAFKDCLVLLIIEESVLRSADETNLCWKQMPSSKRRQKVRFTIKFCACLEWPWAPHTLLCSGYWVMCSDKVVCVWH